MRIISLTPLSINCFASLIICSKGLEYSGPLVYGTTQKLQNLSQPSCIVKNDEIISFGNTGFSGRPHAEVNALNKLSKEERKNSTIYISLEPCSHYGKTPPCVTEIIKSNIKSFWP